VRPNNSTNSLWDLQEIAKATEQATKLNQEQHYSIFQHKKIQLPLVTTLHLKNQRKFNFL
jgi:hypothetical protein